MKTKTTRTVRTEVVFTKGDEESVIAFLQGALTTRQLASKIGYSHQGAINLVTTICRQWIQSGKLKVVKQP